MSDTGVSARGAVVVAMCAALCVPSVALSQGSDGPRPDETVVTSMWGLRAALNAGERDIYLAPGEYNLGAARLWLGASESDPLTLRGAGREQSVLVATMNQDALASIKGGNVTLQDLGFDSTGAQSEHHAAISMDGSNINILNCDIVGSASNGVEGSMLENTRIVGNRFIDNGLVKNHQLYVRPDIDGMVLANNEFWGSDAEMAIKLRANMDGGGTVRNVAIVGNTVHDRTGYDAAIGADNPIREQTLENFILAANDTPSGNFAAVHDARGVTVDTTSDAVRSSDVTRVESLGSMLAGVDGIDILLGDDADLTGEAAKAAAALDRFLDGASVTAAESLQIARLLQSASVSMDDEDTSVVTAPTPTAPETDPGAGPQPEPEPEFESVAPPAPAVPEPGSLLALLALAAPVLARRR